MTDRQRPTIVVLGGINMDLIATAPRLPLPGETLPGQRFYTAAGGKGANQAVAAAKLGAQVKMVGRVGRDVFDPMLVDDLRKWGIGTQGVAVDPEEPSGIAVILLDALRQNHIVAIYGANMRCDSEQVEAVEEALEGARFLLLQMEVPSAVSLAAAEAATRAGVEVIWDPAPAGDIPPEVCRAADIMTPNQAEAQSLTDVEVTDVSSARAAAESLRRMGAGAVVVKLGEMGAYFLSQEASGHVPGHRVEVVDTVAAGDAFAGALAVAVGEGADLESAVRFGVAAGAVAVTRPGAQAAMPVRGEVESLLASNKRA